MTIVPEPDNKPETASEKEEKEMKKSKHKKIKKIKSETLKT